MIPLCLSRRSPCPKKRWTASTVPWPRELPSPNPNSTSWRNTGISSRPISRQTCGRKFFCASLKTRKASLFRPIPFPVIFAPLDSARRSPLAESNGGTPPNRQYNALDFALSTGRPVHAARCKSGYAFACSASSTGSPHV